MDNHSKFDDIEFQRQIEDIRRRFENADPSDRDIETFCRGFTGEKRDVLMCELISLDISLRRRDGHSCQPSDYSRFTQMNQSLLDAVPSGFLNVNFHDLLDDDGHVPPSSPRYEIGPSIGRGGIGEVYRVFDTFSRRPLALKTLHRRFLAIDGAIDRFHRECLLTGTLQHPGIPPVYDHGTLDDGTPYFSMKLVEGQTFHQILQSRPVLQARPNQDDDRGYLIGIFQNIAQTIAYAHARQVIHRDLKPQNVMIGQFGEVQVMDWGLAKPLDVDSGPTDDTMSDTDRPATPSPPSADETGTADGMTPLDGNLTTAGDIVGTPGYMAPEQARGEVNSLDTRADVFGLGAILFQILTGQTVFQGVSRSDAVEKTRQGDLNDAMRRLDQCRDDADLVDLCRRCLNPDPAGRPADAAEVAENTEQYVAGLQRRVRQAEIERSRTEVRIVETRKRQRWIVSLTSALTAVAVVASVIVGIQWSRASRAAAAESLARKRAESETAATNEINEFLDQILSSNLPEELGHDVTLREVVDQTLPELDGKFTERPRVEGAIRRTLGESYRWLGKPEIAEDQLRLALAAFEKIDPAEVDEEEILETKDRLAGVLRSRGDEGDWAEAKQLRSEVLERSRTLLGESHPRTIRAMNNLGTVLLELNEIDDAAGLFREALRRIDASPNPELFSRTWLQLNLADIDRTKGEWDSAEAQYLEVINDPQASTQVKDNARVQLGEMLHDAKRYDASIRHLRESIEVREQFYGPLHPLTLSAIRKTTRVMNDAERYDELLELLRVSLDRHAETQKPAAGTICEARSLMAKALIGLGRHGEAEDYVRETIELISRERGAEHKYALEAKEQLDTITGHPE